jgi:serine/threonine protein kinase
LDIFNNSVGKYELIKNIGHGGTAEVMLARHRDMGALRAVKIVPKAKIYYKHYDVEINVLNNLNIKGVPIIYDVEEDEQNWYIIEEYIDGITFSEYIANSENNVKEVIKYICDICSILHSLHSAKPYGIIYGDLKPDNIIIDGNGELYIVDFGNCTVMSGHETELSRHETELKVNKFDNMATMEYAAPEQLMNGSIGIWTDIYSIGVLLQKVYKCYCNEFAAYELELTNIIAACLRKDPLARIDSLLIVKKYLVQMMNNVVSDKENNIYVYGCRRYSGVTHFSLGLTRYMNKLGYRATYYERNSSKSIINIVGQGNCEKGIYNYRNCNIVPDYGEFCDDINSSFIKKEQGRIVNVYDCGMFTKRFINDSECAIMILADVKEYNDFIYNECVTNKEWLYIANFSSVEGIRHLRKEMGIDIIKMPFYENPFYCGKDIRDFYNKIINKTTYKKIQKKGYIRLGHKRV